MSQYRESSTGSLSSLISGAVLGAAGLAWWLFSEAERRQQTRKQKAMMYAPRIQDGSEAFDTSSGSIKNESSFPQIYTKYLFEFNQRLFFNKKDPRYGVLGAW